MNIQKYIEENKKRIEALNAPYDPILGTQFCHTISRKAFNLPDAPLCTQYIPIEALQEPLIQMLADKGSVGKVAQLIYGGAVDYAKYCRVWWEFVKLRCKYDFEFWCATQISISYKGEGKSGMFRLNYPQRAIFLPELELLRKLGQPIDIILLKARQWGGSTMTQFYMFWIQLFWRDHWNSCIVADVDDQAKGVMAKLTFASEFYPTQINNGDEIKLTPFGKTDSVRQISGRNCTISVGSAQHPSKIRSQDISMAHLTEVGIWKKTEQRTPQEVVASVFGSINPGPYTLKVLESTARGVGNYFHHTWLGATGEDKDYKNSFRPVFVPWFKIEMYQTQVADYAKLIASLSTYEKYLFDLGATLEAIAWYREKLLSIGSDKELMMQEFPSTPHEAFRSSGNRFYPAEYVNNLRKGCEPPRFVGEVCGAEQKGKESLEDVHLVEESNGSLKVWLDRHEWTDAKMSERYLVVVDIGGRSKKADRSVICVFDRYWMHEIDGIPEIAAEWCGHIEHDLLAWKAAQLAHYYDDALLVVESNTLETKGTEGNHFNTLLMEIAQVYENMYRRTKQEQIDKGGVARYGFHTNSSTKPEVCDWELVCLRDGLYVERCAEAVEEHETFEIKQNGELGAVDGSHDDRHITRAIGNYISYKKMGRPKFVTEESTQYVAGGNIVSEYTM